MEMQIWNNAVFDDGGSSGRSDVKLSSAWHDFRPLSAIPPAEPFFPGPGKENREPSSPAPPARGNISCVISPTQRNWPMIGSGANEIEDVEVEIEKIEEEIARLQARLQELRLRKMERDSRANGKRGRIVPSKFMDLKQSPARKSDAMESPATGAPRLRRASVGPLEICAGAGVRRPEGIGPPGATPIRSVQNKGRSCLQKLHGITEDEGEEKKKEISRPCPCIAMDSALTIANPPAAPTIRRGLSLGPSEISAASPALRREEIKDGGRRRSRSGSPRLKKSVAKIPGKKVMAATKPLQPKKLFQETRKSFKREAAAPPPRENPKLPAPEKRPQKAPKVRTVSSRYSLVTVKVGRNPPEGKRRKWSLPGADKPLPAAADEPENRPWMEETIRCDDGIFDGGRARQPAAFSASTEEAMDLEDDEQ